MNDRVTKLLFFLHIPKNSGTTLNQIIRRNYARIFKVSWDHASPRHARRLLDAGNRSVFAGYQVVSGHFPYGLHRLADQGERYDYLTMLRDPIDRCLSEYTFMRRENNYVNTNSNLRDYVIDITLKSYFSRHHPDIPNHIYVDNCQVRYLSGVGESKAFGEISRDDLETAKQNLSKMTFGITEEFNRSMLLCRKALDWKSITYRSARVGSGAKRRPTPSEMSVLLERNALDIELYRHALELFHERTAAVSPAQLEAYAGALARYARIQQLMSVPRAFLSGIGKWFR